MVSAPETRRSPELPVQNRPVRPDSPRQEVRLLVAAPRPPVTIGFAVNLQNPTHMVLDQATYSRAEVCDLLQQVGPPITFVLHCTSCDREVRALPFNVPGRFLCSGCASVFQV